MQYIITARVRQHTNPPPLHPLPFCPSPPPLSLSVSFPPHRSIRPLKTLQIDEFKVPTLTGDQLAMRAVLDDAALVEDVDHVGRLDGAEAMRDGDGRASLRGRVQGCLDYFFGFRVQR